MGQKIHPVGFRLGITKSHQSQWFANSSVYSNLILEDYFIRTELFKQFSNGTISEIKIKRKFKDKIQLIIYSPKPESIIKYYKNNLQNLSNGLIKKIKKYRNVNFYEKLYKPFNSINLYSFNPQLTIQIFELPDPDTNASYIADLVVEQLQKRVAFRRAVKKALRLTTKAKIKGIKIQISGRLNGAEIARNEWIREGQIPLQTLRSQIDYCYRKAKTIYGILGVKVWVFKN